MKRLLAAAAAIVCSGLVASATTIPPIQPPIEVSNLVYILNNLIAEINAAITPQSTAPANTPRNIVDNPDMAVQQRGVGTANCGTATAPTATAFGADRWLCDVNVTSGAGIMQASVTSPPLGAPGWQNIYRTSGALKQPVCAFQAITNRSSVSAQGKPVMLSFDAKDLGGLVTDNGGVIHAYIMTGTAADQGFGSLTASPAITPAWTGIASTLAGTFTLSTSDARYSIASPVSIPNATKEIAVAFCFTPTATGAGATDGFAFSKVQLEVLGTNSTGPSTFENQPYAQELAEAERFYYQLNEPAQHTPVPISGMAESTSVQFLTLTLPVPMRGTTPVLAITTGSFALQIGTSQTTWVTPIETGTGCSISACGILTGNTTTALSGITVTGDGGSGILAVQNDVIE